MVKVWSTDRGRTRQRFHVVSGHASDRHRHHRVCLECILVYLGYTLPFFKILFLLRKIYL